MTFTRRNSQLPITAAADIRAASTVNSTGPIPGLDEHSQSRAAGTAASTGTVAAATGVTAAPPATSAGAATDATTTSAPVPDGPAWTSGTAGETVPVTHGGRTYRVKQGDTLYGVASKHGVSVPALAELNRISPRQNLGAGQILSLPEKNELPDTDPSHVVAPGETLQGIAARHGVSPGTLRRANSMGESSVIAVGELLLLRDSAARRHRRAPVVPASLPRVASSVQTQRIRPSVVAAARLNKGTLLGRRNPAPSQAKLLVAQIAEELGAEPALMQAVAMQESGFQHTTVSPTNAIGIMQVTPRSGRWASDIVGRGLDLLDVGDNIVAGTVILGWLLETTDAEDTAIAGYYQDLRSVFAHGMLSETKSFVRNVQLHRRRFREAP